MKDKFDLNMAAVKRDSSLKGIFQISVKDQGSLVCEATSNLIQEI